MASLQAWSWHHTWQLLPWAKCQCTLLLGEELAEGQNDCFPGLVYDQKYNAYLFVNATLLDEGIAFQTNKAKVEPIDVCITSDWKNTDQVVGGVCPYIPPKSASTPEWKVLKEDMNSLSCQPIELKSNIVWKVCRKLQYCHQQLHLPMSAFQDVQNSWHNSICLVCF